MTIKKLAVLTGPPLHGKSTVAKLLEDFGYHTFDVDEVRNELWQKPEGSSQSTPPEIMATAYRALVERARALLNECDAVAISGTFSKAVFKQPLEELLTRNSEIRIRVFYLVSPGTALIEQRIEARRNAGHLSSIQSLDKYERALTLADPWSMPVPVIQIRTDSTPAAVADEIMRHM